jgi:hypothetical protein
VELWPLGVAELPLDPAGEEAALFGAVEVIPDPCRLAAIHLAESSDCTAPSSLWRISSASPTRPSGTTHANGWEADARRLDAETVRRLDGNLVRDRAKRVAKHLQVLDLACAKVLADLESGKASVDLRDYPALVKLEQLLVGEPTDRIETREVRELVLTIFRDEESALVRILEAEPEPEPAPERRRAMLAAFREQRGQAFARAAQLAEERPALEEPAA